MKYVPTDKWPAWIRKRLGSGKNYEVKENDGYFYLYMRKNTWDKELKRPVKKIKYLGVLKERGARIREHGHVALLMSLLSKHGVTEALERNFPNEWKELLLFSLNRVVNPSPLKRMGSWSDKTTLLNYLDIGPPSGKSLSRMLANVGINSKGQSAFMRQSIKNGELLLYDGSMIYSASGYNKLLEIGYNKHKLFLPKANITLLFSKDRNVPVHFRVFFGSVNEIKTVKAIMDEIKEKSITFIADKGYYRNGLYDELDDAGIGFVMPLPRKDVRIDYKKQLPEVFEYRKRIIKGTSYRAGSYRLYFYEDQRLRYEETTQYYKMKLAKKETGGRRRAGYNEDWAGKIALLSNRKLETREAYLLWKTRDRIEKAFHVLQNCLETDRPYMSGEDTFRGYMFASFISLFLYYLTLNLLQGKGINDKVSVEDAVFEFSKVMVEEGKYPIFTEIPKKVEELAKKLGVDSIVTKMWES